MPDICFLKRQRAKLRKWPCKADFFKHVLYLLCSDYVFYWIRSKLALVRFEKTFESQVDELQLLDRRAYVKFEKYEQAMAYGKEISLYEERELILLLKRRVSPWTIRLLVKSGWFDQKKSKEKIYGKERVLAVFGVLSCFFVLSIITFYGYQIFNSEIAGIEKIFINLLFLLLLVPCILVWGYQLIGPFLAIKKWVSKLSGWNSV